VPPSDSPSDPSFDIMSSSPTLPPATGPQRIDRRPTPLPSLTAQSDVRVQAAIAASARAEASLSGLYRAIQHLGTGVGGAREANELLTHELEALRDMLGAANEQQLAFKQKVAQLEQALDRSRKDAEREREFLTDQHDAFIVDLMDEQEGELERRDRDLTVLRERLAEIERRSTVETVPPPTVDTRGSGRMRVAKVEDEGTALDRAERAELERTAQKLAEDRERARETVARLQAQRDEAQGAVTRITKERDDALSQINRLKSELGGPRIPLSTRPPPVESRKPDAATTKPPAASSKIPAAELTLDHLEIDARLGRPTVSAPQLNLPPRNSPLSSPSAAPRPTAPAPSISSIVTPPRSNPLAAPLPPRLSPPPEELRIALTASPALQPLGASSRPPLKQKPDVSTRPLVGYSLNDDSVEPERLEGVRLSKPPPDKR
jgi:hypothetical protein